VILLHQSVPLLNHALACRFVHCTSIKIRFAKGYVGLALLKQRGVVHDSSAIGSHPSHFGRPTRHAAKKPTERSDQAKSQRLAATLIHALTISWSVTAKRPEHGGVFGGK
jgi:hypothetical protein